MNWLLDILLGLTFLLVVVIAADRGFVKSIWGMVTIIGSFVVAYIFGPLLGGWICDNFVLDHVSSYAFEIVEDLVEKKSDQYDISGLFNSIPEEFLTLLENCGASIDDISSEFSLAVTVSEETLYSMARDIALPISKTLSNAVGMIAVFLSAVIVLIITGLILKLAVKMPILHSLDSFLGFVFGIAEGFVIVWILCVLISLFVEHGFVNGSSSSALYDLTDSSVIFKFFCGLSPIDFINIRIE